MKRSEARERVRRGAMGIGPDFLVLTDETCDRILAALPVEVGPDEPELPDSICFGPTRDDERPHCVPRNQRLDYILYGRFNGKDRDLGRLTTTPDVALVVMNAYNNRSRWCTGDPGTEGRYLVKVNRREGPEVTALEWYGPAVGWQGDELCVVAWQPLPPP